MPTQRNVIVLVDEADKQIGTCDKLEAHRLGLRHRAISIVLKNSDGELLIQRRADRVYHSANLWANTCCSHPMVGETVLEAARRRLREELGIACKLEWKRNHTYHQKVGSDLIENEFVHVFFGVYDGEVKPNELEVSSYRWTNLPLLRLDMIRSPENYTVWFKDYIESFGNEIKEWGY